MELKYKLVQDIREISSREEKDFYVAFADSTLIVDALMKYVGGDSDYVHNKNCFQETVEEFILDDSIKYSEIDANEQISDSFRDMKFDNYSEFEQLFKELNIPFNVELVELLITSLVTQSKAIS